MLNLTKSCVLVQVLLGVCWWSRGSLAQIGVYPFCTLHPRFVLVSLWYIINPQTFLLCRPSSQIILKRVPQQNTPTYA